MDVDDVIVGRRADAWRNVVGRYGDPFRMIVVNKLVARALNHFSDRRGSRRITEPHTLILESIAALSVDSKLPIEVQMPALVEEHTDIRRLAEEFPSLAGTSLLDIGSGSGHLGGWLSTLGVQYTGVEPSAELHLTAQQDPRLARAKANLFQVTLRQFCEGNLGDQIATPTLITIVGVLDHLSAPEDDMRTLFDFLARRDWLNTPVLVATFDPDFFLPGLPTCDFVRQEAAHYGVPEVLGIRDPATWEELFVNCDFHVLEQRPLHVSGLPPSLSSHIQAVHKSLFEVSESKLDDLQMLVPGNADRVPPRQGPFYFWLLCPRNVKIKRQIVSSSGIADPEPTRLETFSQNEALSVVGNLGPRVYRLKEGRAYFESPETGRMEFGQNALFGQLETSCNYISSRVLGSLTVDAGTQTLSTASRHVLRSLTSSVRFADELFLNLLHHLSSVQFTPFTSTRKSSSTSASKVINGTPHRPQFVCNVAACLLQTSANKVGSALSSAYRSRILIELGEDELAEFVFGPKASREADKFLAIFPELVQANVIDSFSAHALEISGAQTNLDSEEWSESAVGPVHIGWQAARYLHRFFAMSEATRGAIDIEEVALAISAYLGSDRDRTAFKIALHEQNQAELRNHGQAETEGKPKTVALPRTVADWCAHVVELVECAEKDHERVRLFLETLRSAFDHNDKANFARKYGMSRFIVVRDIWALLACLLDAGNMWNTAKSRVRPVTEYARQDEQQPRIIAYIQECIAHAGRLSGLASVTPFEPATTQRSLMQ